MKRKRSKLNRDVSEAGGGGGRGVEGVVGCVCVVVVMMMEGMCKTFWVALSFVLFLKFD